MKLDFNIQINQKQGLALTAQVQQAIKLLHMTNREIRSLFRTNLRTIHLSRSKIHQIVKQKTANDLVNRDLDKSFKIIPTIAGYGK